MLKIDSNEKEALLGLRSFKLNLRRPQIRAAITNTPNAKAARVFVLDKLNDRDFMRIILALSVKPVKQKAQKVQKIQA